MEIDSFGRIVVPEFHRHTSSRVVGEYGGNIEPISNRHFHVTIRSPNQVDLNGQAPRGRGEQTKGRERVEFNQEPCHIRQGLHLLCPPTCRCDNSIQGVEEKTEAIRGYGLNTSGAELIAAQDISKGDVVAVFGKTATLWTSKDVR